MKAEKENVFVVRGGDGQLTVCRSSGKVISRESPDAYPEITQFNVREHERFRGEIKSTVDILDIGYMDDLGYYQPPEKDFRRSSFLYDFTAKKSDVVKMPIIIKNATGTVGVDLDEKVIIACKGDVPEDFYWTISRIKKLIKTRLKRPLDAQYHAKKYKEKTKAAAT
jgi:hypothetical protein